MPRDQNERRAGEIARAIMDAQLDRQGVTDKELASDVERMFPALKRLPDESWDQYLALIGRAKALIGRPEGLSPPPVRREKREDVLKRIVDGVYSRAKVAMSRNDAPAPRDSKLAALLAEGQRVIDWLDGKAPHPDIARQQEAVHARGQCDPWRGTPRVLPAGA
jgi:hypothetical protein